MAEPRAKKLLDDYRQQADAGPATPGATPADRGSEGARRQDGRSAAPEATAGATAGNTSGNIVRGGLVQLDSGLATMLDLRLRTGHRVALPYSYLGRVDFDPSGAIVCAFASTRVVIRGRALSPVYSAITSQTALAVVESKSGFDDGGDEPFVEGIEVIEAQEDAQ